MNEYNALKDAIRAAIKPNGEYALTAQVLQNILIAIVNSFGKGYQFMGIATADTTPGEPDEKEFYVGFAGEYANFVSETVTVPVGGVVIFLYDTEWHANVVKVAERAAVSGNHLEIDGARSIIEQDIVNVNTLTSQGEAFLTAAAARAAVSAESGLRIGGQVITYLVETDEEHHTAWVVDQFTGDDAEGWENDDNWQPFLYVELAKIVSNQAQINEAIMEALGNRYTKEQVDGMIEPLSERMGTAEEGLAAEILRAQAAESRLQNQYDALTQNPIVIGPLPSSGQANTIYRVPGTSSYSDYMWDGTQFVLMATYSDGRLDFINVNLLNATGSTPHAAYATADTARADISAASGLRALGLQITYLLTDGVWYTDQYIGTDISGWSTASNWKTLGPVSVSQNTITLPDWTANTPYVVGNQCQNDGHYYRCSTAHTSGETFNASDGWTEITDFDLGGTSFQTINIGSVEKPVYQSCIKLSGIGTSGTYAPNIGDIYYQTSNHLLRKRVAKSSSPTFVTIPFIDGAIYTYNNQLYVWDGADLIQRTFDVDDSPNLLSEKLITSKGASLTFIRFNYGVPISSSDWVEGVVYYNIQTKLLRYYKNGSFTTIDYNEKAIYLCENINKNRVFYRYDSSTEDIVLDDEQKVLILIDTKVPGSSSQWERGIYYNTDTKLIRWYDGILFRTLLDPKEKNIIYLSLSDNNLYMYDINEDNLILCNSYTEKFNQIDSQIRHENYLAMEQGTITNAGDNQSSSTRMRLIDYFPIESDVDIVCNFAKIGKRYYDADKVIIGNSYTSDAKFLRFFLYDGRMTTQTANNDFLADKDIIIDGLVYYFVKDKILIEKKDSWIDTKWHGKKILWFGTSIPNGGYPNIVGDLLGVNIINQAVGASIIVSGYRNGQTPDSVNGQRAFSATKSEKEALFGTTDYNIYSFEELLLPYLDGTYDAPDAIVLEYGSDWNTCRNDEDRSNFPKLNEDSSDLASLPTDSVTQSLGVNFNRFTYTGAMLFIINLILQYKPYMRIYIMGYQNNMRRPGDKPAMITISDYWQIPYCDISSLLGWSDRIVPGSMTLFNNKYSPDYTAETDVTQFRMWCPDDWHPHTNGTRLSNGYKESNYYLATKVAKWLNEVF